jgi:hypothetical protein
MQLIVWLMRTKHLLTLDGKEEIPMSVEDHSDEGRFGQKYTLTFDHEKPLTPEYFADFFRKAKQASKEIEVEKANRIVQELSSQSLLQKKDEVIPRNVTISLEEIESCTGLIGTQEFKCQLEKVLESRGQGDRRKFATNRLSFRRIILFAEKIALISPKSDYLNTQVIKRLFIPDLEDFKFWESIELSDKGFALLMDTLRIIVHRISSSQIAQSLTEEEVRQPWSQIGNKSSDLKYLAQVCQSIVAFADTQE